VKPKLNNKVSRQRVSFYRASVSVGELSMNPVFLSSHFFHYINIEGVWRRYTHNRPTIC